MMHSCALFRSIPVNRDTVRDAPSTSGRSTPSRTGSAAFLAVRTLRRQCGTGGWRCRASPKPGGAPSPDEELFEKAVVEAEEILERATELAEEATRKELLQGLLLDANQEQTKSLKTLEPISDIKRPKKKQDAAQPTSPTAAEGLTRFWQEEGLRPKAAAVLAEACLRRGGPTADPDHLFSLLERLRRVLPDADVVGMASKDPDILQADVSVSIRNLVALRQALPDLDVIKLVETAPSLLWADDVGACAKQTIALLRKWGPRSDVTVILETYPEMIIRIPKYYANTEFFELPLELQNIFAVGGGGGGQTWRSWAEDEDPMGEEWNEEIHGDDNNTD